MLEITPYGDSAADYEERATTSNDFQSSGELLLATVIGFSETGSPIIKTDLAGDSGSVAAITTVTLTSDHLGRQVAVMLVDGNSQKPVVIGLIRTQLDKVLDSLTVLPADEGNGESKLVSQKLSLETATVDGKKVEIKAEDEIVLTCGESSISLEKSGKIIIKGKYLISRSSGVNRVLGGAVQIN